MKRTIAILLLFAVCCSFAACNEQTAYENKSEIVGEWLAVAMNASAIFYEDGSGELSYHGVHAASWLYNAETDKYIVSADKNYSVSTGKEYDMPYVNIDGIDFYRLDDYDKAYTLLISRRYEDIIDLTCEMNKLEKDTSYDLANGVTVQFDGIEVSKQDADDGILLSFVIMNNRTDQVTDGFPLKLNFKYYLYDHLGAVEKQDQVVLASAMDAQSSFIGSVRIPLGNKTDATISYYGRVIGAISFEMYGTTYYIDLGEYFR